MVLAGKDHHGHRSADALVAAAAVAHDGYLCACHTCIAGTARFAQHFGEDAVAHDAAPQGTAHGLAELMAVVLAQAVCRRLLIQPLRLKDKPQVVKGLGRGEVIDFAKGEKTLSGLSPRRLSPRPPC